MTSDKKAKNIVAVVVKSVRKACHPLPPRGAWRTYGRGHELLVMPVSERLIWKRWCEGEPKEYKKEHAAYLEVNEGMWIMNIDGIWYEAIS